MTTRILLLRHAETSAPDLFHGAESDVGLGETGRAQAKAVAGVLAREAPRAIYSSGMRRARETAGLIACELGLKVSAVDALHERKMGTLSLSPREASGPIYEQTLAGWESGELDASHPSGESFAEIRNRVVPAFLRIAAAEHGRTAVVVAHGVVIRVLLCSLVAGMGPADLRRVPIAFVGIHDLRSDGEQWRRVLANSGEGND